MADNRDVDPALWPLVEAFPPIDVTADTLPAFRAAMVALSVKPDASSHPDVRIEELTIANDGKAGGGQAADRVRCLLYKPAQRASAGALLHIHGGGFVMGMPEMDVARNIELVRATGCTILSVDYRLAPEHPHPAGLEDCHAALVWLADQAEALGFPRGRIGVIGESAGGGIAASLALLVRDRNAAGQGARTSASAPASASTPAEALRGTHGAGRSAPIALACEVLIYPMMFPPAQSLDATAPDARTGRYIWTRTSNSYCWSAFLAGAPTSPATLAGLAPDVTGLPPTFLAAGELDLFVLDDLAYARRLLAAGCSVEAHLYPGAIHGFDRMVEAPVSVRYTRDLVDFIKRHLG